jgi:hypothetical protein
MKAIESGISAAAVAPETRRASANPPSEAASPAVATVNAEASVIAATVRYLPCRSPTGPHSSWQSP